MQMGVYWSSKHMTRTGASGLPFLYGGMSPEFVGRAVAEVSVLDWVFEAFAWGLDFFEAAPVGLGLLDTDCSFEFLAVGLGLLDTGCSFEFLAVVLGLLETGCKSESLPVPLDLFEAEPGGLEFIRAAPVGVGSYCVGSL